MCYGARLKLTRSDPKKRFGPGPWIVLGFLIHELKKIVVHFLVGNCKHRYINRFSKVTIKISAYYISIDKNNLPGLLKTGQG